MLELMGDRIRTPSPSATMPTSIVRCFLEMVFSWITKPSSEINVRKLVEQTGCESSEYPRHLEKFGQTGSASLGKAIVVGLVEC